MATLDVKQTGGSYSSLSAALSAANASDTISIEGTWTVDDTTGATIADDNLIITTDANSKHPGYWDTSQNHYRLVIAGSTTAISLSGAYTASIDGVAIEKSGTSGSPLKCEPGTSDTLTVTNCIFFCSTTSTNQDCIYCGYNKSIGTVTIENCVIIGGGRTGVLCENCTTQNSHTATVNINSCVVWDCGDPSPVGGVGVLGSQSRDWSNVVFNVHNSIVVENTVGFNAADFRIKTSYTSAPVFNISYTIDSDNSIATVDGTGTGNLASRTAADSTSPGTGDWVIFEDITTTPYDLRIVDNAENDAQDAHTTATAEGLTIPSTDIVGTSRPQNTSYDIGAFEIVAGAPPAAGAIMTPNRGIW